MTQATSAAAGTLTDGKGVSAITLQKLAKDFVADALLQIPPALVGANIVGVPQDKVAFLAASFAIGGAVIGAAYRSLLRWATT